jgi:hypothetical protein
MKPGQKTAASVVLFAALASTAMMSVARPRHAHAIAAGIAARDASIVLTGFALLGAGGIPTALLIDDQEVYYSNKESKTALVLALIGAGIILLDAESGAPKFAEIDVKEPEYHGLSPETAQTFNDNLGEINAALQSVVTEMGKRKSSDPKLAEALLTEHLRMTGEDILSAAKELASKSASLRALSPHNLKGTRSP